MSAAVIGWIPRLLLWLVVSTQTPTFDSLVWWWECRPHAAGRNNGFLSSKLSPAVFISASHLTGHNPRSMTRRSIIVGVEERRGRAWAETRTLLDYAGHHRPPEGGPAEVFWPQIYPWHWKLCQAAATFTFCCCLCVYVALAAATPLVEEGIFVHRKIPY